MSYKNIMNPDLEKITGLSNATGVDEELVFEQEVLSLIETHLTRRGDERKALIALVQLLKDKVDRRMNIALREEGIEGMHSFYDREFPR